MSAQGVYNSLGVCLAFHPKHDGHFIQDASRAFLCSRFDGTRGRGRLDGGCRVCAHKQAHGYRRSNGRHVRQWSHASARPQSFG